MRACTWYGAGPAAGAARASSMARRLVDLRPVPARAVLLLQRHQVAGGVHAGGAAGVVQQHQGEQPLGLRLVGHQRHEQPGQPDRLRGRGRARTRSAPAGGRVALVEQQVEHARARRPSARAAGAPGGTRNGIAAWRILCLARTSRCAIVVSGTRNARAISAVDSPAQAAQGQRDLAPRAPAPGGSR